MATLTFKQACRCVLKARERERDLISVVDERLDVHKAGNTTGENVLQRQRQTQICGVSDVLASS